MGAMGELASTHALTLVRLAKLTNPKRS